MKKEAAKRPKHLSLVPKERWPSDPPKLVEVWESQKYLVQVYDEEDGEIPALRISVCRTTTNSAGGWEDNISWEELQDIKRSLGFSGSMAVEIYPPDKDVVNVANMRHLWLLDTPLNLGWKRQTAGATNGN